MLFHRPISNMVRPRYWIVTNWLYPWGSSISNKLTYAELVRLLMFWAIWSKKSSQQTRIYIVFTLAPCSPGRPSEARYNQLVCVATASIYHPRVHGQYHNQKNNRENEFLFLIPLVAKRNSGYYSLLVDSSAAPSWNTKDFLLAKWGGTVTN